MSLPNVVMSFLEDRYEEAIGHGFSEEGAEEYAHWMHEVEGKGNIELYKAHKLAELRQFLGEIEPNLDCSHCDTDYVCWECESEQVSTKHPDAKRIGDEFAWEIGGYKDAL